MLKQYFINIVFFVYNKKTKYQNNSIVNVKKQKLLNIDFIYIYIYVVISYYSNLLYFFLYYKPLAVSWRLLPLTKFKKFNIYKLKNLFYFFILWFFVKNYITKKEKNQISIKQKKLIIEVKKFYIRIKIKNNYILNRYIYTRKYLVKKQLLTFFIYIVYPATFN